MVILRGKNVGTQQNRLKWGPQNGDPKMEIQKAIKMEIQNRSKWGSKNRSKWGSTKG